ncbi:hypothetical protein [Azospirillum brasilense]|uniref:hypothetical protein n=1 Tax=Azospirillum brasilense TaxID=192 RepID=UPI001EDB4061|nr:hypothetical protein [Azospirillum brasilense]UKJ73460.1 hypothetical protein H1Q64_02255 [Azospirillum brasilense]
MIPQLRSQHAVDSTHPKVLVISEDPFSLAALSDKLSHSRRQPVDVVRLSAPEYAVEAVDRHKPDVIVTDSWYGRLGQECWRVLDSLMRRRPNLQVVVIDDFNEVSPSRAPTNRGQTRIARDAARQDNILLDVVYDVARRSSPARPRRRWMAQIAR